MPESRSEPDQNSAGRSAFSELRIGLNDVFKEKWFVGHLRALMRL